MIRLKAFGTYSGLSHLFQEHGSTTSLGRDVIGQSMTAQAT